MPHGISDRIINRLVETAIRHPEVEALWLYGSRARGDYRHYSDIDIVVVAPTLLHGRFGRIFCDFDDLPIVYPMDILFWGRTEKAALREEILADHKVLYSRT